MRMFRPFFSPGPTTSTRFPVSRSTARHMMVRKEGTTELKNTAFYLRPVDIIHTQQIPDQQDILSSVRVRSLAQRQVNRSFWSTKPPISVVIFAMSNVRIIAFPPAIILFIYILYIMLHYKLSFGAVKKNQREPNGSR